MQQDTFGEYILRLRVNHGINLRQMSRRLNVSATYVADVENGRRHPYDLEKIAELKQIFELDDDEYITLLNVAGKSRGQVAPDLPEYIYERDYVTNALRTAKDLNVGEEEWLRFVEKIKEERGLC